MTEEKEKFAEAIRRLIPVNDLSEQLQNDVIEYANILEFKKKQFIFKEGDEDEYSYYALEGEIELLSNKQLQNTIIGGSERAIYPMAQLQPRKFSAKAKTNVTILQINRATLDRLMVADHRKDNLSGSVDMQVSELEEDDESGDWMTKMLQSKLFSRLPTANIHQLFALLEPVEYAAGETVIKQGDTGKNYFIIQDGQCEVTYTSSPDDKPLKLAVLHPGDGFGEEALLTEAKRNATISMLEDGLLMRLSKDNFMNLIMKPALESVNYAEAKKLSNDGAVWLDVRFKKEHEESCIEGSMNISLNVLREQINKLDKSKKHILYCDTGGRSSAATFLLTQQGFDVCFLDKGLIGVPQEDKVEEKIGLAETRVSEPESETPVPAEVTAEAPPAKAEAPPAKAEAPPAKAEAPPVKAEAPPVRAEAPPVTMEELTPDIRASVLETEIVKKQQELEKARAETEAQDAARRKEQEKERRQLEKDQKKLEAEKKAMEKEAERRRHEETARIEKLKKEAEKQLQKEKKKLEEIYAKNAAEMKKMQRMKQEAEEKIKKEREKIALEVDEERQKFEKATEEQRLKQDSMEKEIQAKAKAMLEEEKRKLAETMSRSSNELAEAKRAQAAANAAKKAAQEEAQKIINEYKEQFRKEQVAEESRIREERRKLEEESSKIQDTLKEIQKAKEDAEATRKHAEIEAARLKAQLIREQEENKGTANNTALQNEVRIAEETLSQANKNLDSAMAASHTIEEAKEVNQQDLIKQKEEEEKLSKQMAKELAEFISEFEAKEKKYEETDLVTDKDYMRRIKEKAEDAKNDAQKATDNLFADIASQLGTED